MIIIQRTNSDDKNFQELVKALDLELSIRDGKDHLFLAELNKTDFLEYAIVAYDNDESVGCGALREYSQDTIELKRMFVPLNKRKQGIASIVLAALETWCKELNFRKCFLETGKNQPEAINFYKKNGYMMIPNFGKYAGIENSICFEKDIIR